MKTLTTGALLALSFLNSIGASADILSGSATHLSCTEERTKTDYKITVVDRGLFHPLQPLKGRWKITVAIPARGYTREYKVLESTRVDDIPVFVLGSDPDAPVYSGMMPVISVSLKDKSGNIYFTSADDDSFEANVAKRLIFRATVSDTAHFNCKIDD